MSAYRTADEEMKDWTAPVEALPAPFKDCPSCGQNLLAWICPEGHVERAATSDQKCMGGKYRNCRSPTRAGYAVTFCSPEARIKTGWLSRCDAPGTHVHNECNVCGWRGISKPLTDLR